MAILHDPIHRYPAVYSVHSNLDPLEDLLTFVESLTSTEYLVEVISSAHGRSLKDASRRAAKIVAHIKLAREIVDQSLGGPNDAAFLPSYDASLNFAKVYILLGPPHGDPS